MKHGPSLVIAFSFLNLVSVAARARADVDPVMVGTWETSGVNAYGPWKLTWEIRADSSYFISGAFSDSGIIGSGDGRWQTRSNLTKQTADGTYTMSDANHMLGTGPLGSASWTRVAGPTDKQASPSENAVSAQLGGNPFEDAFPQAQSASPIPTRSLTQEESDARNDYINAITKKNQVARDDLEKKAQGGILVAQDLLGMLLENENKFSDAVNWYRKAAEQGDGEGMRHLGLCYWSGQGVEKSPREAIAWWKQAAGKGNQDAEKSLKMALEKFDESGQSRTRK